MWFKFGYCKDIVKRLKDHIKEFGDQIRLVSLFKCANGEWLEKRAIEYFKDIDCLRELTIRGDVVHREIIVTVRQHPIVSIIARVMYLRDKNMTYEQSEIQRLELEAIIKEQRAEVAEMKCRLYEHGITP